MRLPLQIRRLLRERLYLTATRYIDAAEVTKSLDRDELSICLRLFPNHDHVFRDPEGRKFTVNFLRFMQECGFSLRFSGSVGKYLAQLSCGATDISILIETEGAGDICELTMTASLAFDEEFWCESVRYDLSELENEDLPFLVAERVLNNLPDIAPREASSVVLVSTVVEALVATVYNSQNLPSVLLTRGDFEDHVVVKHNVTLPEIYEAYLQQTAEPVKGKEDSLDPKGRMKRVFLGIASMTGRMIQPVLLIPKSGEQKLIVTAWDLLEEEHESSRNFWMDKRRKRWRLPEGERAGVYAGIEKVSGKKW